jgi:hypothetical protein
LEATVEVYERKAVMPAASNAELSKTGMGDESFADESFAEWGDMRLDFAKFPPHNLAPLLKGLPDDRCQCPHWGYLFKGSIIVRYADHEETISAGQAFYMPPGHAPEALEECELIQFSPSEQLREVIEVITRNAQSMNSGNAAPSTRLEAAEIARHNA